MTSEAAALANATGGITNRRNRPDDPEIVIATVTAAKAKASSVNTEVRRFASVKTALELCATDPALCVVGLLGAVADG